MEGEPTLGADEETQHALAGYRDAMTYVLQIAGDERLEVDEGLLKSLHFMMIKYDLAKNPGQWRPGDIYVRNDESGEIVYQGPASEEIPELIAAMLLDLKRDAGPVLVKAAMAHLNLVLIHPFSDSNGRMGRCLQTLLLARDRVLAPVFSSIEEFLGRNTEAYYQVLTDVGAGSWHPERDARPWIRFCLRAHHMQIRTMLRRREEIEQLWNACVSLAEGNKLPERCAAAIMDSAYGLRIRRASYQSSVEAVAGEEISEQTASRDLMSMVSVGLLEPVGERRARYYLAGEAAREKWREIRAARPPKTKDDPFALVRERRQLSLKT
ncbi:MAG TPA: Fic family protein [Solirubrobacterales bacterium]|nr:Fic family protein [Solirubrobacterales bacterium]